MSKKNSRVSVIILCYNAKKYIEACLRSLKKQTYNNIETIIIDNGSKDGSSSLLKNIVEKNNIVFIDNGENFGYARGNNIGIDRSTGEYALLLNPDVILNNNYIESIVKFFETDERIGAVSGKILKYKIINGAIKKTNIIDSQGIKIYKSHRIVEINAEKKDLGRVPSRAQEVFGISAAAAVYRKKALEQVKKISLNNDVFDEDFFIYKEDIDLSWRLRHAGWHIWCAPEAVAYHDRWETGTSISGLNVIKKRKRKSELINIFSYRNHLMVIAKNQFLINLTIFLPAIILYELKKILYLLLFERKTLKGLRQFIFSLPLTCKKRNAILSKSKIKPSDIRRWF